MVTAKVLDEIRHKQYLLEWSGRGSHTVYIGRNKFVVLAEQEFGYVKQDGEKLAKLKLESLVKIVDRSSLFGLGFVLVVDPNYLEIV